MKLGTNSKVAYKDRDEFDGLLILQHMNSFSFINFF